MAIRCVVGDGRRGFEGIDVERFLHRGRGPIRRRIFVIETNDCAPDPPEKDLTSFKIEPTPTRNAFASVKIELTQTKVESTNKIGSTLIVGPQNVFETSSGQPINAERSSMLPQARSTRTSPGEVTDVRFLGCAMAFLSNQQPTWVQSR
jgi:hypothetical protein